MKKNLRIISFIKSIDEGDLIRFHQVEVPLDPSCDDALISHLKSGEDTYFIGLDMVIDEVREVRKRIKSTFGSDTQDHILCIERVGNGYSVLTAYQGVEKWSYFQLFV